jgi:hypothetical protein
MKRFTRLRGPLECGSDERAAKLVFAATAD